MSDIVITAFINGGVALLICASHFFRQREHRKITTEVKDIHRLVNAERALMANELKTAVNEILALRMRIEELTRE